MGLRLEAAIDDKIWKRVMGNDGFRDTPDRTIAKSSFMSSLQELEQKYWFRILKVRDVCDCPEICDHELEEEDWLPVYTVFESTYYFQCGLEVEVEKLPKHAKNGKTKDDDRGNEWDLCFRQKIRWPRN